MTMLWTAAIVFHVAVYTMAHEHVVFTEESASTTFTSQEMERFPRTLRKHSHDINGKGVLLLIMFEYS
jgi:hypothetical protein